MTFGISHVLTKNLSISATLAMKDIRCTQLRLYPALPIHLVSGHEANRTKGGATAHPSQSGRKRSRPEFGSTFRPSRHDEKEKRHGAPCPLEAPPIVDYETDRIDVPR